MRWPIGFLALTACGRIGFDRISASDGDIALVPMIVQTPAALGPKSTTALLPMLPTHGGNLLVVMTANIDTTATLSAITDDAGNAYVSANTLYTCTGVGTFVAGEIWYV